MLSLGINTFWHRSSNFGDQLTPYLVKKISGYDAVYTELGDITTLMVTGSILSSNVKNSIIWGCGYAWSNEDVHKPLKICAVRGCKTRDKLWEKYVDCPDVVGDPALLLPRYYNPTPAKKYKLGIIPHIIDHYKVADQYFAEDALIINLTDPIEKVIFEICQCEKTISSSLHGIIASHAYGIDCLWVNFSDKIIGDGFKYLDYFTSVRIDGYNAGDLRDKKSISEILSLIPDHKITFDGDKLLNSCPLNELVKS